MLVYKKRHTNNDPQNESGHCIDDEQPCQQAKLRRDLLHKAPNIEG